MKNKVMNNVKNCGQMALYFLSLVTRNAGGFFLNELLHNTY